MRSMLVVAAVLALAALAVGCGGQKSAQTPEPAASAPAGGAGADFVVPADLDQGPRAVEGALDEAKAEEGEKLFQTKGCSACHGFGRRISGPDLNGVTGRRTARWMETQILHPDKMTHQDPISRSLFATYALQMPNQGLTPDQARSVIEFLKKKNKEAGESK